MAEQANTWKIMIRLFLKLIQHQAELIAGESFLSEVSGLILDFVGDKSVEQIQSVLDWDHETAQIKAAFKEADECFAAKCVNGDRLHQVIRSYPLSDNEQLEKLAAELPDTLEDAQLREVLAQRFEENSNGKLSPEEKRLAVERYLECLNKALAVHAGQILETMYRKLDQLSEDHKGLHEAILKNRRLMEKLSQQIAVSTAGVPLDYSYRIQEFLYEYLGTEQTRVPFGGRTNQFAELDAWLGDEQKPYALLAAPSGRGKSALLCRWVQHLKLFNFDNLEIIFIPISVRFQTASSSVSLAMLASRLAKVHGEELKILQDPKGLAESYLSQPLPENKQVLVVLDALDEALDWKGEDFIFPAQPPKGLQIIVSARYVAGDAEECGWLDRLGWNGKCLAHSIHLPELDEKGIAEVLASMGNPLSALGKEEEVVHTLLVLTEGDPLLVKLYVVRLAEKGKAASKLTLKDLQQIQPGYEGYFDLWWQDQCKLWQMEGHDPDAMEDQVQGLLDLLTMALGPLTFEDLNALKPAGSTWGNRNKLKRLLKTISRFVHGDGITQGFIFSHPKLQQYFREKFTDPDDLRNVQERFLGYGKQTFADLNQGILPSENASSYVIQFYGAHLADAQAPSEEFYALLIKGWLDAWVSLQGTYSGFLMDVERAWERAREEGTTAIGKQVQAALCFSSVASLSSNVPDEVLVQCVKMKAMTLDQAVEYARRKSKLKERAGSLGRLIDLSAENKKRAAISREALEVARSIEDSEDRSSALAEIAPHLPPEQALEVARRIENSWNRSSALAEIASHLPPEQALEVARRIEDFRDRSSVLAKIAPHLPPDQQQSVLLEALEVARIIKNFGYRSSALAEIAPHLPSDQQQPVLSEALDAARRTEDSRVRSSALAEIAPHLPSEQALEVARSIEDSGYRSSALTEIVPHLPSEQQKSVLSEALEVARRIEYSRFRSSALAEITPHLPTEQQQSVLLEALEVTSSIKDSWRCSRALAEIAPHLPPEQALQAARSIVDFWERSRALAEIAPHLPSEQALDVARSIKDSGYRSSALAEIAPRLPLEQALEVARSIENSWGRSSALAEIAPHLPYKKLFEAWSAIANPQTIDDFATGFQGFVGRWQELCSAMNRQSDELIYEILKKYCDQKREGFLKLIRVLIPVIEEIGGKKALAQTVAAIQQVGEWWP